MHADFRSPLHWTGRFSSPESVVSWSRDLDAYEKRETVTHWHVKILSSVSLLSDFLDVDDRLNSCHEITPKNKLICENDMTRALYRHRNDPHHRNDLRHRNDTGGHHLNDPRNIGNGIKRTTKTGQQLSACFLFIYIASFSRWVIYLLPPLFCTKLRGKSARTSPTPHHTLNEERNARFTAQTLSALLEIG